MQAALPALSRSQASSVRLHAGAAGLGSALSEIADELGFSTENMAATAQRGGEAIGFQLAEGIASAVPYIVGVLRAIGEVNSWWLEPASPPELHPTSTSGALSWS
jgi:hypothetical protein